MLCSSTARKTRFGDFRPGGNIHFSLLVFGGLLLTVYGESADAQATLPRSGGRAFDRSPAPGEIVEQLLSNFMVTLDLAMFAGQRPHSAACECQLVCVPCISLCNARPLQGRWHRNDRPIPGSRPRGAPADCATAEGGQQRDAQT